MIKSNTVSTIKKVSLITTNIFTLLFALCFVGQDICVANSDAISSALGQATTKTITGDDKGKFSYTAKYYSINDVKKASSKVLGKINDEGITLLKNKDNTLPLAKNSSISLYSSSSVNYIYQGGGSSFTKSSKSDFNKRNLKVCLQDAGFSVNTDLWNFYSSNTQYFNKVESTTAQAVNKYQIYDANWSQITSGRDKEVDTGIFVLSRYGTEASDLKFSEADAECNYSNGDYLELTPSEISVLEGMKALKDAGKIGKIVVLLNSVAQVELNYKDSYGIDSILWVGQCGSAGCDGIADILSGSVNPSGKLPDTFFNSHSYNPVYANFGALPYSGTPVASGNSSYATVYQEGIYNGYRYTETRYYDKLAGRANVGDFDYDTVVAYPFGHGLSYTTFTYSDFSSEYNSLKDQYTLSVKVTNSGSVKGKESVQFYLTKPYTEYDVTNHIEKSAVDLVGFAKTNELAPGASQVVSYVVSGREFASYDSYNARTYILEGGDYYFSTGINAHDATNNVLKAKENVGSGNAALTSKVSVTVDDTSKLKYSKTAKTNVDITNQFDNADINLNPSKGTNSVTYISRNNWSGTVKFGMDLLHNKTNQNVQIDMTAGMVAEGQKLSEQPAKMEELKSEDYPKYNANSSLNLASLMSFDEEGKFVPVQYNDSRWEELLDKLSWDETVMFLSNGLRNTGAISSIAKPKTIDGNGGVGPTNAYNSHSGDAPNRFAYFFNDPNQSARPYGNCCAALIAATYNVDLASELGDIVGENCLWAGYSGIYGLGVNLHRSMYSGRAWEYYSEDGILSGVLAAAEAKTIRARGVYVYMKHCVLNETEEKREGLCTFANEQTIRELYLRPYQIAIEEAGAENVMTAYNRIGTIWSSQQGFINTVLRKEFGMTGFAVSDYWQGSYMDLVGGLVGGSALPDGSTASSASASALYKYGPGAGYGKLAQIMREETHKILHVIVNSSAMNGFSSSTKVINITPQWLTMLNTGVTIVDICFAVSLVVFVGASILLVFVEKKEKDKIEPNAKE